MSKIQVAIDGSSSCGKSTIAKLLSQKLNLTYIDTGAMYRAVAFYCLENGIKLSDERTVAGTLSDLNVSLKHIDGTQRVFLNGNDVSDDIRTPNVSQATSIISTYGAVRRMLVEMQRKIAENTDIVMDGRDIGTVVLPFASHKIFLTASVEVRTQRRIDEFIAKGENPSRADIEKEIIERDERDITRKISPLRQADDAILLDTSDLNVEEVLEKIVNIVRGGK